MKRSISQLNQWLVAAASFSTVVVAAATSTGPALARFASSTLQALIGRPWISASGLPGRRVDAMRAGMTTTGFMGLGMPCGGSTRKAAQSRPSSPTPLGEPPDAGHKPPQLFRAAIKAGQ